MTFINDKYHMQLIPVAPRIDFEWIGSSALPSTCERFQRRTKTIVDELLLVDLVCNVLVHICLRVFAKRSQRYFSGEFQWNAFRSKGVVKTSLESGYDH